MEMLKFHSGVRAWILASTTFLSVSTDKAELGSLAALRCNTWAYSGTYGGESLNPRRLNFLFELWEERREGKMHSHSYGIALAPQRTQCCCGPGTMWRIKGLGSRNKTQRQSSRAVSTGTAQRRLLNLPLLVDYPKVTWLGAVRHNGGSSPSGIIGGGSVSEAGGKEDDPGGCSVTDPVTLSTLVLGCLCGCLCCLASLLPSSIKFRVCCH